MATPAVPVTIAERHEAIDLLRGFAVLGILVMNIQSFAMPFAAYFNPTALGDRGPADFAVWLTSHLFFDQKFMTIFSMLFGAGIAIMTSRVEARGGRPALLHYRRMFWLLVFGLIHAYLIWYGDILVLYAVCGSVAYLFRRFRPAVLLTIGLLVLSVGSLIMVLGSQTISQAPPEVTAGDSRLLGAVNGPPAGRDCGVPGRLAHADAETSRVRARLSPVRNVDLGILARRRIDAGRHGAAEVARRDW